MTKNILEKPAAFQEAFTRRPGNDHANTHYCAGCGHGVVHKLIAEALSEMGLQDRAIFIAPVGCSVFLYYYFNCCAVSVPHGRAPAALTGISTRTPRCHLHQCIRAMETWRPLARQRSSHAANRGEQMAVFFVNNAIYGMTGGQMAPTTLIDMKTATSPTGRSAENDGQPIRVCEMLATLDAPVYIERVSVDTPQATMRARAAIRKALQIQDDRKGFALVEILSPCPTNWRMDPVAANTWLREKMYPVFPLGVYRDHSAEARPFTRPHREINREELYRIMDVDETEVGVTTPARPLQSLVRYKLAGYGGQGVLLLGCDHCAGRYGTGLPCHLATVLWPGNARRHRQQQRDIEFHSHWLAGGGQDGGIAGAERPLVGTLPARSATGRNCRV